MSISLILSRYSAAIALSPTIEAGKTSNKGTLGFFEFLASFSGCARGASNRLSVSGLIAPPSFRGGPGSLGSSDASQDVVEMVFDDLFDVPSQNLAGRVSSKGQFVPALPALLEGHTHNQLSHKRDRSPVVFSKVKIMSLELRTKERFAKRLARFVEKERARIGCAKTAVKNVARKVGLSAVNVYRAMNGYGPVTIKAHHYAALLMLSLGSSKVAAKFRKSRTIAA